jgi:1,4-dihydroxy-2-naphthoyl-CoA hydrolase
MLKGIFNPETIDLEALNRRCDNTMASFLAIQFTEVTPDYLKAEMPVNQKTVQPLRMLNGGASFALAENLGSLAANLVLDRQKFVALGLDMNGNHLRPAMEGETVYGFAFALHIGEATQVWEIQIKNKEDKLLFIGRLTMAVKPVSKYNA